MICLAYNRIDEIREHDFSKPIKVDTLKLKYNVITNIHKKAFENLKELRTLDLSYNRITVLPSSLFESNSKLENLFLQSNMLSTMGPIVHSVSLKNLDITSCTIYHLPHNAFVGVPNLNTLHLNNNPLTSLATDTFETLTQLRSVTMEPTKSICLPKSFQNVIQYFKNKSVNYFPTIVCELDYKCYINNGDKNVTATEIHLEMKQNENQIYYNHVGCRFFITFACVFTGGIFCVLLIYECLIRRKVASYPNVNNSKTQKLTISSGNNEITPWYKSLLYGISHDSKENKDVGVVRH
jgi:Leucine-rich repeat (LRR) protein